MRAWQIPLFLLLAACGGGNDDFDPAPVGPQVERFREDAVNLLRREPVEDREVTIQYILIGMGVERGTDKPRLRLREAESKAADLYHKAKDGDTDFDRLVLTHSYDRIVRGARPGMYTLVRGDLAPGRGPTVFQRKQMEPSVWKAAWRLKPGELGAIEQHADDAETGYYVIRRLTDAQVADDDPANQPPPDDRVAQMRDDAATIAARDEHDLERVRVQHILIARWMSPSSREGTILEPAEAESLAAEVYEKAQADPDAFSELVREFTFDDIGEGETPGEYELVDGGDRPTPPAHGRADMVKGFGDTAWRLEVGEVGVLMYHRAESPYGYHIIKRLE